MKLKKKPKKVKKNHPNCGWVDKYGRQFYLPDIRVLLYRAGHFVDVTFSSYYRPEKLWPILDE